MTSEALWALGRGTGVVALVLFTMSLVLGVVARSGRPLPGLGRFGASDLHRTAALTGTGLILVHVVSLFFDSYAQLRLADLVIPFLGSFKPLWQGLGTLALDLLAVITVVSLLRKQVGPRVFRAVHYGTYLLWPISLAHALGNGTDSRSVWMLTLAAICSTAVGASLIWRVLPSYGERGMNRAPREVSR